MNPNDIAPPVTLTLAEWQAVLPLFGYLPSVAGAILQSRIVSQLQPPAVG